MYINSLTSFASFTISLMYSSMTLYKAKPREF